MKILIYANDLCIQIDETKEIKKKIITETVYLTESQLDVERIINKHLWNINADSGYHSFISFHSWFLSSFFSFSFSTKCASFYNCYFSFLSFICFCSYSYFYYLIRKHKEDNLPKWYHFFSYFFRLCFVFFIVINIFLFLSSTSCAFYFKLNYWTEKKEVEMSTIEIVNCILKAISGVCCFVSLFHSIWILYCYCY